MAKKKSAKKKSAKKRAATKKAAKKKAPAKKKLAKKPAKKIVRAKAAKRELIDTGVDKRYVRRDEQGRFDESVDVGRSLSQDRRIQSETVAAPGQGDRGDRV